MGVRQVIEEQKRLSGIAETSRGTDWLERSDLIDLQKKVGSSIRAIKKVLPDLEDALDNANDALDDRLGDLYKANPLTTKEAAHAYDALQEVSRLLTGAAGKLSTLCAQATKISAAIGEVEAAAVALNNMTKER